MWNLEWGIAEEGSEFWVLSWSEGNWELGMGNDRKKSGMLTGHVVGATLPGN